MEESILAGLIAGATLGSVATFAVGVALVLWIWMVVAKWRIFTKAGIEGWKSLIPFYSTWLSYELAGLDGYYCLPILLGSVSNNITFENMSDSVQLIMSLVVLALSIAGIVFEAKRVKGTATAFGKGTGFAVGLFFLGPIFETVLAFGNVKYQAPAKAGGQPRQDGQTPMSVTA